MQAGDDTRYEMGISLRVLDHLGLNLYSNTPAVIAEAIANAWDADATRVEITLDPDANTITVADNGDGMELTDVNNRYLLVGYRRRVEQGPETSRGRKPMGRKGIGKLSLFSIGNRILVHTKKSECEGEAFLMDALEIRRTVAEQENAARERGDYTTPRYHPKAVGFDAGRLLDECGTTVSIAELKMQLTQSSVAGLRKRIARRFGLLANDFEISVNSEPVAFSDRDYFGKARFIFQYGSYDYSQHCPNLDRDECNGEPLTRQRDYRFDTDGKSSKDGLHQVQGWIAIARRSNDLDDRNGDQDDNLNKITLLMRGKVAQEDILQEYRLGGMITKYIFGELHADFLDEEEDIATTSRQRLAEDHHDYLALKKFVKRELNHIWTETNTLKEQKQFESAIQANPYVKKWYDSQPRILKPAAKKIFKGIDIANMDDEHRHNFYATAVTAFEQLKVNHALDQLESVNDKDIELFLSLLTDLDSIEATHYFQIVNERLTVIRELDKKVNEDVLENVLQKYIFDHLWLLDPAWERATAYAEMERSIQAALGKVSIRGKPTVRPDIRYRRISGAHVIIELKRPSVRVRKSQIEDQIRDYIDAVNSVISKDPKEQAYPIEAICLLGQLPIGWEDPGTRKIDEDTLRPYGIRVMTYTELIARAREAYAKFIEAHESVAEIATTVEAIRSYRPPQTN